MKLVSTIKGSTFSYNGPYKVPLYRVICSERFAISSIR